MASKRLVLIGSQEIIDSAVREAIRTKDPEFFNSHKSFYAKTKLHFPANNVERDASLIIEYSTEPLTDEGQSS